MKNRQELAKYFAKLGFKAGAEIGVCKGYYSKTLCESIPNVTLYGVDNWSSDTDSNKIRNIDDAAYKRAVLMLEPYIASGQYKIIRKKSMEALADIPDESLDFVFIDAGHTYDDVKKDVEEWAKKVRVGGIVSGHDYYESKEGRYGLGIIKAVDEYIKKTGYVLQIIGWDKENPDRDSRQPCWYFVKDT